MPIQYHIDHDRRLVLIECSGVLTDAEAFDYQKEIWSRPDLAGYHGLVDVTAVEKFAIPSGRRIMDLASLGAAMDSLSGRAKFAIVAPQDIGFGMARMYEMNRNLDPRSTREVAVFRTRSAGLAFLGLDEPDDPGTTAGPEPGPG